MEENTEKNETQTPAQEITEVETVSVEVVTADCEQPKAAETECPCEKSESPAEACAQTERQKPRKNRRNKGGASKSSSASSAAVCGEIEDPSSFKEKLSGSHLEGYEGGEGSPEEDFERRGERRPRRERGERGERGERRERRSGRFERDRRFSNECREEEASAGTPAEGEAAPEAADAPSEEGESRSGPAFEKPEFKPRAVEVSLDKRPSARREQPKADFISYSSVEEPKIGILNRIRRLFASIFKKEKPGGASFRKNRKGDFKGRRGGDRGQRKFSNSKGDFKKGGQRGGRNFRPNGRRPEKGSHRQGRPEGGAPKQP